jgi:hypothetical protein
MDTRTLATVSLALLALLLPLGANAGGSASATLTVSATVLPPLPAGAVPLGQSQQALSRSDDSWPGYRLAPGPGGEPAAIVLSPDRYRTLTLAPQLEGASARINLQVCQAEQRAQSDRHNEAAREWAAQLREARALDWQRVAAWVGLGVALGAVAGGTAVWVAK